MRKAEEGRGICIGENITDKCITEFHNHHL